MRDLIRLSKSSISESDIMSVTSCLQEEYLGTGEYVKRFESAISSFGFKNVVATSSGTSALQLALQAHGIGQGDEVLVPTLTYLATYQSITALGAQPISCDVRPLDLSLCPHSVERLITTRTKAIVHVHYASLRGSAPDILLLARQHGIPLIEDAAHSFGDFSICKHDYDTLCYSFDGIKNITCGEGGAVCSIYPEITKKISDLRLLGVINDTEQRYINSRSWDFDVVEQGWRYHMSNINASLGLSQLTRISTIRETRQRLANTYLKLLSNISCLQPVLPVLHPGSLLVPHIYPVIIKHPSPRRDLLRSSLAASNVQLGIHYKPNHLLSYFKDSLVQYLPVATDIYPRLISFPLHLDLLTSQQEHVVDLVSSFYS